MAGYRLIGCESRLLNRKGFNEDRKDTGKPSTGHTITAMYEIVPARVKSEFLLATVYPLKC